MRRYCQLVGGEGVLCRHSLSLLLLLLLLYSLTQNYQSHVVSHMGKGLVFSWLATPPPQRVGSQPQPNFGGCFLFMRTPFVAELPNLRGNTWGGASILGVSHAFHPKRAEFQCSQFFGGFFYIYT